MAAAVANRSLGTIDQIAAGGQMTVKMDTGKTVTFDPKLLRHFDQGYAVTSHSSQGLTADRVLVHVDHAAHPDLINNRFAYVALSRGTQDSRLYTNDLNTIATSLASDAPKSSAVDFKQEGPSFIAERLEIHQSI